jgi:hypothetical protein
MKTGVKATATALIGFVVFVVLLFLPAGTFNYWQGWLFIAVFAVSTSVPAAYLIRTNPAAVTLIRRFGVRDRPRGMAISRTAHRQGTDIRNTNAERLPFNGSHGGVLGCVAAGIDGDIDRGAAAQLPWA